MVQLSRVTAYASALIAVSVSVSALAQTPPELAGASPGERDAIQTLCESVRGATAQHMCLVNQVIGLSRTARKPDLSVASADQRRAIDKACAVKEIPAERFACEREQLTAAGLTVRNEPGGSTLVASSSPAPSPLAPSGGSVIGGVAGAGGGGGQPLATFPAYSLESWRQTRPPMPATRAGAELPPAGLYDRIWPSIYVVVATDAPAELAERSARAQGSAVAISDHVLLTNCHVVAGRPQIRLTQQGKNGRATVIYADPAGDRCFLRTDDFALRPVPGVRRFADLHVGETVFSLGTPSGLELSFNQGLVSALRQQEGQHLIQNSAPSWHGSSGGGLFDARGNLIGITTAGSATVPNTYFSIAADDFWP